MSAEFSNAASGQLGAKVIVDSSWFYSVWMKKPSDGGRRPVISCENFDYSKENLQGMTLVDKSLHILVPLHGADIYMKSKDPNLRRMHKGFLRYIAETATSVTGFQDITLNMENPVFKSQFMSIPLVTVIQNPTQRLTFRLPSEIDGYGITEGARHWMNAISDEYSRVAHYNGLDIPWNNWSHSAAMAYIKPDKTFKRCQFVALLFMMIPLGAPISNFDTDATATGITELNLEFSVAVIDGRNVRVRRTGESLLQKYSRYIVSDSSLYGMINNTTMGSLDALLVDDVFENMEEND